VKENSIKEDIKIIENILHKGYTMSILHPSTNIKESEIKALEHILSDYKRVLKENEELKVELERQKDINTIINQKGIDKNYEKALEKSMLKFLKTNMAKDFVSVQKVKDKIEELKQKKKKYGNCLIKMYEDELVNRDIKILQELLEGRK
jgi:hypothetical protein